MVPRSPWRKFVWPELHHLKRHRLEMAGIGLMKPLEGGGRRRVSAFRRLELGGSSRQPLTREEQETAEAAERMLQTPLDTSTPEGQHLEAARLTNLAEPQRLSELQNTLEHQAREVARLKQSRTSRQLRGGGERGPSEL